MSSIRTLIVKQIHSFKVMKWCIPILLLIFSAPSQGQTNNQYSQQAYGGVGLIVMPSARFDDDGEFLFGVSSEIPFNRMYAKMQFFPWGEFMVRYTEGTFTDYNPGSKQTWKDKGFDVKLRLIKEGKYFPQIALGLGDIGGQGAFGREFIVASKRINDFDFTLGLGWGRYAGFDHIDNPLSFINDGSRGYGQSQGGALELGRLFTGDYASIFGGFEYNTPIPNLTLKVEYDTSDYSYEEGKEKRFLRPGEDIFTTDSRINYALNYQYSPSKRDNIDFSLGLVRGNTIYANVAVHSNLNTLSKPKIATQREILNEPYLEPYNQLSDDWKKYLTDLIMWQLSNEGFITHRLIFNGDEMLAEVTDVRLADTALSLEIASRVLANNSPKNISKITVINIVAGIETLRSSISRDILTEEVAKGSLNPDFFDFNNIEDFTNDASFVENEILYPHFSWSLRPHALGTLQHQIQFYFWQVEALLHLEYAIKNGLYFTADYGINIANNFDDYDYHIPDGQLHHVRQDRRLYLTEGESGLRKMALDYFWNISPNIKGKASAGILEWMYGGYGGEIVYFPDNKHWALGIDAYWVKQREFDQKFSFRDYETVTGLITAYYDIPFYDMRAKISYGKFLGKDKGFLIDLSRRFETGARVGGKIALTDCDAACVGEGSFNKWIYFELPMDLFFNRSSSKGVAPFQWAPLTKDSGQQVYSISLYDLTVKATDNTKRLRKPQLFPSREHQNNINENSERKSYSFKKIFSGFSTQPKQPI